MLHQVYNINVCVLHSNALHRQEGTVRTIAREMCAVTPETCHSPFELVKPMDLRIALHAFSEFLRYSWVQASHVPRCGPNNHFLKAQSILCALRLISVPLHILLDGELEQTFAPSSPRSAPTRQHTNFCAGLALSQSDRWQRWQTRRLQNVGGLAA